MKFPFQKILVPTDLSENSKAALQLGLALARQMQAGLKVLHVIDLREVQVSPYLEPWHVSLEKELVDQRLEQFEAFCKAFDTRDVRVEYLHRSGIPFVEIIRFARETSCDLIVMGTHGRTGIAHILIGSVAEKVVRKASCPVMTVKGKDFKFEPV